MDSWLSPSMLREPDLFLLLENAVMKYDSLSPCIYTTTNCSGSAVGRLASGAGRRAAGSAAAGSAAAGSATAGGTARSAAGTR